MSFPILRSLCCVLFVVGTTFAQEETTTPQATSKEEAKPKPAEVKLTPLNKQGTVQVDAKGKRVLITTEVVLREGSLEMLCCLMQTKEHESILALNGKAYTVHAGLLAIGLEPGQGVRFNPYRPPTGTPLDVHLIWTDKAGKEHRRPASYWLRSATRRYFGEPLAALPEGVKIPENSELRFHPSLKELSWYGIMSDAERDRLLKLSEDKAWQKVIKSFHKRTQIRPMKAPFVFVGSQFGTDSEGQKFYRAEGGDLICVANFPSATIDVGVESTATGETSLLYEAWTERIPPEGTKVVIEIQKAKPKKKDADGKAAETEEASEPPTAPTEQTTDP